MAGSSGNKHQHPKSTGMALFLTHTLTHMLSISFLATSVLFMAGCKSRAINPSGRVKNEEGGSRAAKLVCEEENMPGDAVRTLHSIYEDRIVTERFEGKKSLGTSEHPFTFVIAVGRKGEISKPAKCVPVESGGGQKLVGRVYANALQVDLPGEGTSDVKETYEWSFEGAVPNPEDAVAWKTAASRRCSVNYEAGFEGDASRFVAWADDAAKAVEVEFESQGAASFFAHLKQCDIYLYSTPNIKANVGQALAEEPFHISSEAFRLKIHFLAPSAMPSDALPTATGRVRDADYFRHLVVHEFTTSALEYFNWKAGGWQFTTEAAPNWFIQGYEDSMGFTYASERNRTVGFSTYKNIVKKDSSLISFGGKVPSLLPGGSDYIHGAVLCEFLRRTFGPKALASMLVSKETTFEAAFVAAFGETRELETKWKIWLEE